MRRLSATRVLLAAAALVAVACSGDGPTAPSSATGCSVAGQNRFVRDTLQDIYLWYRELPDPDPVLFASPAAYLEAVRYRLLDTSFSYVTDKATSEAFFSDSQFIGFGFRMTLLGPDELRVVDVYAGSPAAEAGLDRGTRFLEINGRTVAQIVAASELGTIFGPTQEGVTARVRFLDRAGREHDVTMAKRLTTIPTVAVTQTYRVGNRTVGYVLFENFVRPSTDALNAAFTRLRDEGAQELVLDLRYNGGGLISVAQQLGALIGGSRTRGQVFVRFVHNDKNSQRDNTQTFPDLPNALAVDRLVVIASRSSASASELVINSLRPFMDVTIVGDRTFGKPVGQYGFDFCDKTLFPVAFFARNARNEGDYFDGLPATCAAPDDLGHAMGDADEGSLAEAFQFIRSGQCSAAGASAFRAQALRRPPDARQPHRESGWQVLLGSY